MSQHKANKQFFARKRQWSERKDLILDFYLKPYLAKIATLNAPILLIDGFAGPGEFEDGAPGSPLIFARHVKEALVRRPDLPIRLICIEADPELYQRLSNQIDGLAFAEAWSGEFIDSVPRIAEVIAGASSFLYLDPYTVDPLEWLALESLFAFVARGRSVEVLLNFNSPSFVRRGLAALSLAPPSPLVDAEEATEYASPSEAGTIENLNRIVGGDWWQGILRQQTPYETKIDMLVQRIEEKLRTWFDEVLSHPVPELPHHRTPKYHMIFASRHPSALRLMNDAMRKSQDRLAALAETDQSTLFEIRPKSLVPDPEDLKPLILEIARNPQSRGTMIESVMRTGHHYTETEIRRAIASLLTTGELSSASGRTKINDRELIFPSSK